MCIDVRVYLSVVDRAASEESSARIGVEYLDQSHLHSSHGIPHDSEYV